MTCHQAVTIDES